MSDPSAAGPSRDDHDDDPLAALRDLPPPEPLARRLARWAEVAARWPVAARVALAVGVVAAVVGGGFVVLRRQPAPAPELSIPTVSVPPATATVAPTTRGRVVAHAAGAVSSPGVYELEPGARIEDLIAAAGGATADADLDRLNLAAAVADGERVWVPRAGEEAPPTVLSGDPASNGSAADSSGPGSTGPAPLVNINTASADELDELPGVGPTTAQAIIDHRRSNGPFTSVDELIDVRGIGDAKLAQLRDLVTI